MNAGVFALNCNNAPSNSNNNIGFRLGNLQPETGPILGGGDSARPCRVTWSLNPSYIPLRD